jgi:hypothetical protein
MTTEISTQEQFQEQMKARIRAAAGELMPDEMLQEIVKRGIEELERELKASFVRCGEWATKAGEAQGRLEASEMAGTVQGWKDRATAAEDEQDKLREALAKLTLKWRIDDFNGKNFPTKREAAYEVEAALREPADNTLAVAERSKTEVEQIVGERDKLREALLSAQAAMWDAHYGRGIDTGYAQSVDSKVRAALKEPTDA